jgi:hypothetical protein
LQLDFRLFLQPFLVGFLRIASLYFIFFYFYFEKKRILGNHPKLVDDNTYKTKGLRIVKNHKNNISTKPKSHT